MRVLHFLYCDFGITISVTTVISLLLSNIACHTICNDSMRLTDDSLSTNYIIHSYVASIVTVILEYLVLLLMKAEYIDGIGFLNGKGNPMKEFPKATEKRPEDMMYLKVLCNLYGPDIDEKILQEPLKFQLCF